MANFALESAIKSKINEIVLSELLAYENDLQDYEVGSDEYDTAYQVLTTPHETLISNFSRRVMCAFTGKYDATKFFGYKTISAWVETELVKQGY
jgi:hypothetical protein